jgi:hypothetical protein
VVAVGYPNLRVCGVSFRVCLFCFGCVAVPRATVRKLLKLQSICFESFNSVHRTRDDKVCVCIWMTRSVYANTRRTKCRNYFCVASLKVGSEQHITGISLFFPDKFTYKNQKMAFTDVNTVCGMFSLASLAFFIVACIAYTDRKDDIQNTAWFGGTLRSATGSGKFYVGLNHIYDKSAGAAVNFGGSMCPLSFCSECERDGDNTFALIVIATVFSFLEFVTCFAYMRTVTVAAQLAQMVQALVAAVFSLVGVAIFMGGCYRSLGYSSGFENLHWGTSAILATLGMLMMWVVVFMHIAGAVDLGQPATSNMYHQQNVAV